MIRIHIQTAPVISVRIQDSPRINVNVSAITKVLPEGDVFSGPYSVVPKVNAQTLNTADKYMAKDVSVEAVPFYSVSNQSGGNTVYIANIAKEL